MAVRNVNNRLNGLNPLSYLGDNATQPANCYGYDRDPTSNDSQNFALMDEWLNQLTRDCFKLVNLDGGVAEWVLITGSGGSVTDLTGDTGIAHPALGKIKIAGGTNITTAASGSTVTVDLDNSISLSGTLTVPALTNGVVKTNGAGLFSASNGTNGQLLIGGGTAPQWANLTSTGGSIIITQGSNSLNIEAAGGGGTQGSLVFLAEGTSSGGTSIDFETEITPTYNDYFFIMDNLNPSVANKSFICQLSTDGGGTYITTGYISNVVGLTNGIAFIDSASGTIPSINSYSTATATLVNATSGVGYAQNSTSIVSINDPVATTVSSVSGVGAYQTPNIVVNAIRFLYEDGSAFDGRIKIYGFGTPPPPATTGALVLIQTQTAAADTELDFTTGITSTYNNYFVLMSNIQPTVANEDFIVQLSTNGGVSFIATGYISSDPLTTNGIILIEGNGMTVPSITSFSDGSNDLINVTSGSGYVASSNSSGQILDPAGGGSSATFSSSCGFYNTPNITTNALRFKYQDGSPFSGTVSLYGYVK